MSFADINLTESPSQRRAKIVATLGPASNTEPVFRDLVRAGVDVVRLNFSHGSHEEKLALIKMIRCLLYTSGSEAKSKFAMLNPSDSVVEWVLKTVPTMGAGWCPPGMLGIGIGGTAEKAMLLAKQSLMDPIDIQDLIARGPKNRSEELRIELYDKVNRLGIGAQGLGGLTTVLDVKVLDTPAHAANLPVAMIPNCAATRHAHIVLDLSLIHI